MKKKSWCTAKVDRVGEPRQGNGHCRLQRDVKELMAELISKLSQKLELPGEQASHGRDPQEGVPGHNRGRLTVGVDLGDRWSSYCILGLEGETLAEGQFGNNARGFRGVLPKHGCGASGNGSRDTLGLGVRCHCELRTRSAGGQSAANGRTEAAQTEE